jgi:predicted ABC-type ATPase
VRLDLVVGPNGAGKSTFVDLLLEPLRPNVPFVNADVSAARRWPDDPESHSYEAARIAARTRQRLIDLGEPFVAETVFSHRSKLALLDDAAAAGFRVALHVLLIPEHLAVPRVQARVAAGGHDVPEDKIRSRFRRLWPIVADAIPRAHSAQVWDNSRHDGPEEVALFASGMPIGPCRWPDWTPSVLVERWPR